MMKSQWLIWIFSIPLLLIQSCSVFETHINRNNILIQGNYFTTDDIEKIHLGMTKHQVIYTIGPSILQDPFYDNIWYYIVRKSVHSESVIQQTLILIFDKKDILIRLESSISKSESEKTSY